MNSFCCEILLWNALFDIATILKCLRAKVNFVMQIIKSDERIEKTIVFQSFKYTIGNSCVSMFSMFSSISCFYIWFVKQFDSRWQQQSQQIFNILCECNSHGTWKFLVFFCIFAQCQTSFLFISICHVFSLFWFSFCL